MPRPQTIAEVGDRVFPWALLLAAILLFLGKILAL
jgi:hypothetical protein